ncbi:phage tail fiber protein [Phascolarctobacterium succinatutens]|uniref:phage tail fiber domain-containing protein n=1 Tax=Phascolarctobacterium succinatutens TaxID=626940 RepID=UPI00307A54B0
MTAGSFRAGGLFIFVKEMINIAIKLATSITYTADGSQTNFSIPFDYLRPSFVHVSVNDAEVSEGFTISNRMVMFDSAPAKDAVVHIYRNTPTTRLVSWADASILKAIDMTIAEVQQLHILEEANDWSKTHSIVFDEEKGVWQGRNYRVSNVSDPTEAQDVVTKKYLENTEDSFVQRMNAIKTQTEQFANTAGNSKDSAYKSAQSASVSAASAAESAKLAEGYKNIAETAKSDASLYAANAKTSADNAGASKEAAQSAATTASNFASAARNSANEAQTYRNNAKTYMDNAKNYSENVNVFVPSVSTEGVLSWTNKAGLTNPKSVNIKGAKGDTGTAASIKIGSVTTGAAGSNASVTNSGTASNVVLNFTLPRGKDGADGGVTVDAELSDTSTNPVQNKAIYNALLNKVGTDIFSGFALLGGATKIKWREGTQFIGAINAANYSGTARAATHDGDGNNISTTYAKKTDISGMVKSVNNIKPDSNGNVTIEVSGSGISTSESNTWTAQQNFHALMLSQEKYTTYVVNGTSDTPITSTMVYAVTSAFTLDLSVLAGALSASQSSVFTAYFAANADYSLTISNAGKLKYVGSASDVAITSAGLLLNIWMSKDGGGTLTSIVQANKLGGDV